MNVYNVKVVGVVEDSIEASKLSIRNSLENSENIIKFYNPLVKKCDHEDWGTWNSNNDPAAMTNISNISICYFLQQLVSSHYNRNGVTEW